MLLIFGFGRLASVQGAALGYFAGRVLWNIVIVAVIQHRRGLLLLPSLRGLESGWRRLRGHEAPGPSASIDGSGDRRRAA